jgi:UDP-N-acetylmuramoyl-tripeptide--D-alanyl-D-alanine ligase
MRELGAAAAQAHREIGVVAAGAGLDALFLLGEHAADVREGALAGGLAADRVVVAVDHADLGAQLRTACRPGDLVLLKGSRGAAMEQVLRHLGVEVRP